MADNFRGGVVVGVNETVALVLWGRPSNDCRLNCQILVTGVVSIVVDSISHYSSDSSMSGDP